MRMVVIALGVMLGGCVVDDDPPPLVPDGGRPMPDGGGPCPGCGTSYVIDSLRVPLDADESERLGFDLDDDGTVDNQLGNVLSAMVQASGASFDLQGANTAAVDRGDLLLLASLQDCLPGLCFFTYHGASPAPAPCLDPADPATCGQHLDGSGVFSAEPPLDRFVPGALAGDTYLGGPGMLALELSFGGAPVRVELFDAHAALTGVGATGVTDGRLGGTVPAAAIEAELIPAMHVSIADVIAADCTGGPPPECGCVPESAGATYLNIFDDNTDCALPLDEFRDSSLIATLFRPDVDSDGDAVNDGLSVGVGITAVAATFRQ